MSQHRWGWTSRKTIPSYLGAHIPYMAEVLRELERQGWSGRDLFGIEVALEEALSNAIRHGNCCDASKHVFVECKISPQRFWLRIRDEGAGFQPNAVPNCTADENLERPGGRGLALIKAYMSHVEHNKRGNCVTMEMIRSTASVDSPATGPCEKGHPTRE